MTTPPNPLTESQWDSLQRLMQEASAEQLLWAAGYLAGFGAAAQRAVARPPAQLWSPLSIVFGSQTGNAEKLAHTLHDRLRHEGIPARLEAMDTYPNAQFKRDRCLLVVVSTYGEGDPPDNARNFYDYLLSHRAPRLESLQFAVLALGDTSYEYFCKTGQDIDLRLESLGATRIHPRADCDVDYDDLAEAWMAGVLRVLCAHATRRIDLPASSTAPTVSAYSKKHPFPAALRDNLRLTGRGSSKDVRHLELSLEGSGLHYEPGDALGVVPTNWPKRVDDLLTVLNLTPTATVPGADGVATTLESALLYDYEITTLTRPFLEKYAALTGARELTELLQEPQRPRLREFLSGREILDVVRRYPLPGITPEQFVQLLRKLPPRLYSIASSQRATPDEVHLTVAVVRYETHGETRYGVASTYLADRVCADGEVPVYVEHNDNFRLPADPATPIIMVGPGTGVAPFRAFLAERAAIGARGRNWLYFGDRNFDSDFLYQKEWLEYRKNGLLTHIDVAFSRDGAEKCYVQHRLLEHRREVYAWLEEGAYIYVCGDAHQMAADVDAALVSLVATEAGQSLEWAQDYVKELHSAKRYQRDVY